jgi:hypothetical protein
MVLVALKCDFRSAPINGHRQTGTVGPVRAKTGSRGRGLLDQITGAARQDGALLWKSCFAEAVDINLS